MVHGCVGGGVAVDLLRLSQFLEISGGHVNMLFQKDSSFSSPRCFRCVGFGEPYRGMRVNSEEMQHFFDRMEMPRSVNVESDVQR